MIDMFRLRDHCGQKTRWFSNNLLLPGKTTNCRFHGDGRPCGHRVARDRKGGFGRAFSERWGMCDKAGVKTIENNFVV